MPAQRTDQDFRPEAQAPSTPVELSIVVPFYNEQAGCSLLFDRLVPILEAEVPDYEIVCVNDGSSDGTLDKLSTLRDQNERIKIVDLSRNFGKDIALSAGLDFATGHAVIPIDADLQDPPELIPEMLEKWREGYDSVIAVRLARPGHSWLKRASAGLFYRLMGRLSEVDLPANAGDFRLLDRRVVDALTAFPERNRFMKGLFAWTGFRHCHVGYVRPERAADSSKWRVWNLWNFAIDGIVSFTTLPLRMWSYIGSFIAIGALAYMMFILARTLIHGVDVPGYASLLVFLLFFSGLNMIGLGILGEYIGRIFVEVKRRPLYIVRSTDGLEIKQQQD